MEGVEAQIGEDNHLEDQGHPEQSGETVTGVSNIDTLQGIYVVMFTDEKI